MQTKPLSQLKEMILFRQYQHKHLFVKLYKERKYH